MTPLETIKTGILNNDMEKIIQGFMVLTGEEVRPLPEDGVPQVQESASVSMRQAERADFSTESISSHKGRSSVTKWPIINSGKLAFRKQVPVHATRLIKAFPANIASVPLSFGDTSMNKLSAGFEYESHTTSAINNGKISDGIIDTINGGKIG